MTRSKSAAAKVSRSGRRKHSSRTSAIGRSGKSRPQVQATPTRRRLISRVPTVGTLTPRVTEAAARTETDSEVPEATISRADGPVSVEITFGHAQHGSY